MKLLKKYKNYLLAFFLPLFLLCLFFAWKGCFTDKNILSSDMHAQYVSLFQYLHNLLHGKATFPYSFSKGLGGGMYGSFFYYLANPLNFLVYFFEDIPLFLNLLVILKLSLCGLTMYTFLRYKFQDSKALLVFSLAYVFMNYNINYYVNLMWLDGVVLAPILLIGIEKMIKEEKDALYIVTLWLAIFLNYYIGYILTFFSVLYFGYCFFIRYGKDGWKKRKQIFHFLLITLLIGLTTTFILLPCALELLKTTRVFSFHTIKWINWNFLDLVAPFTIGFGNLRNPLNYFGFCFFSGTCMLPLVLSYFTNQKISKREKVATIILYCFFIAPILFPILNLFWHMFTIPMAFNYRYSFLTVLFTLFISYRSFSMLETSKKTLVSFFILFLIFMASLGYVTIFTPQYFVFLNIYKVVATVLFMGISIYLLLKGQKKVLLVMLVLELGVNIVWIGLDSPMEEDRNFWIAKRKLESFQELCKDATRCEKTGRYTSNDSLLGNYRGMSVFLTTAGGNTISFLSKASDYSDSRNFFYYHPDIFLDSLLGIEYVEDDTLLPSYDLLKEEVIDDTTYYLMHNPNAFSLGYLVSPQMKTWKTNKTGFFYLEELWNQITEENEEYVISLPVKKIDDTHYELDISSEYPYLYLYSSKEPMMDGEKIENYLYTADHYGTIPSKIGKFTFSFEEPIEDFKVYTIDAKKVVSLKEKLTEVTILENKGNFIRGKVNVPSDSPLLLTIPYEKGWSVLVDGKKVPSYEILDTFLAIDISKGTHEIVLKYHIPGLKIGILVSVWSFLLLVLVEHKKGTNLG